MIWSNLLSSGIKCLILLWLVMTIVGVSMTILLSDGSFIYLFVYLFICLLLYVDDMLIVYKNMSKINTLKTQF